MYPGFLFDIKESAVAAYTSRETAGQEALGATKSTVRDAPYLPFHRTLEIGESTIGGVFLYHSEIWAPFLPAHGSVLGRQFLSWLLGFGRARSSRMRGWFDLRELDISAEGRAVRLIDQARQHGSLISLAVRQLLANFEGCSRTDRRIFCWMGRFLHTFLYGHENLAAIS